MPPSVGQMQQQTDIAQLLGAKQRADEGDGGLRDDSGSGMGDMGAQQMAIGSKMASASLNSAIKRFAKSAAPIHPFFDDLREGGPNDPGSGAMQVAPPGFKLGGR